MNQANKTFPKPLSNLVITESQARAIFGDAPFKELAEIGCKATTLYAMPTDDGTGPYLAADLKDEEGEEGPATWDEEGKSWDLL